VTGIPLAVPYTTETTALGAALLALVGIRVDASLLEATDRVVRIRERIEPRSETREVYQRLYAFYRRTYEALEPVFEEAAREGRHPDVSEAGPDSGSSA